MIGMALVVVAVFVLAAMALASRQVYVWVRSKWVTRRLRESVPPASHRG